jgi:hypothetical protein
MSKKWIFTGAAVGVTIPLAFRIYEVLQFGHVRPAALCLFWPTTFIAAFNYPHAPLLMGLAILGNMVVFGVVAGILRRAFLIALAVLVSLLWVFLPPSNAALRRRFDQQRATLQQLTEISRTDPAIARITFDQLETTDGKSYRIDDAETLLPNQRWKEYRQMLGALHMREAIFRRAGNGEVYVAAQTFGVGPIRSYYGYLYCPGISASPSVYVPCMEGKDSADRDAYSYKTLGSNWYIYKVFRLYGIE